MQYADLHLHSYYSDGLFSPEEIVKKAMDKNIRYISITDHDTINYNINDLKINSKSTLLIPGIELSSEYLDEEVHILGYFIDTKNKKLQEYLNLIQNARVYRVEEMLRKLRTHNICIDFHELDISNSNSIGRAHIAKAMISKGYVKNFKEAFYNYLSKNRCAYVPRYKIPYKDALGLIKDIGGISSLAHPGEIYKGISLEAMVKDFKAYGLTSIEVFHPSHNSKETNDYYNLSSKYKFLITGGSDCHGNDINGELLMGTYGLSEKLMNKIIKYMFNNGGDINELFL
ncbi:PHP domain-containing protein [Clostridium amazonitimonense]|uniref:PHP domain-containing protein n=1 Tax=Clostridium amazonitimonense TaxID=1499689 RepID=UPI0005AB7ED6|nr:PHP domain-containing protein [Clostridium amazonitimonense]